MSLVNTTVEYRRSSGQSVFRRGWAQLVFHHPASPGPGPPPSIFTQVSTLHCKQVFQSVTIH